MKGVFEYEGDDMEYFVEWDMDDGVMFCDVFIVANGKVNVNYNLYPAITERIYSTAHDYYWERQWTS